MCGIFGHNHLPQGQSTLKTIEHSHHSLNTLTHRGPDSWGFEAVGDVYLGHRRLSILDLSEHGRQPMVKDGVYLTVNGEIYNYEELREELILTHNVVFQSDSDSEVLLHGYIHWGLEQLLNRVDGMFGFAIYDSYQGKIHLARDHVGIKPLYYALGAENKGKEKKQKQGLVWASELKAIECFLGPDALVIDATAIYDFMTYLYIPCPKTMYQNVFKLEPGHFLTYDTQTGSCKSQRYWQLEFNTVSNEGLDWVEFVRKTLKTAVQEQLVADVPVGFFLSGGVDSSTVCYEASTILSEISTFSIGHVDKSSDESPFAQMVAEAIGSKHYSKKFSQDIANKNFSVIRNFYDEPFGDVSALPTNEVCRLARERVTVVLTGDGGDELFGGYAPYADAHKIFLTEAPPYTGLRPIVAKMKQSVLFRFWAKKLQRFEGRLLVDPMERWAIAKGGKLKTDSFKQLWAEKHGISDKYDDFWYFRKFDRPDLPVKTRAQYIDFHTYMHDSVLTKVDRASMAVALETRVPFLSKKMIAAAWSVPEDIRYADNELKSVLKKAYSDCVPKEAIYRRKMGFGIGTVRKNDCLYDRTKNIPRQILQKLFPELGCQ